ncbi:Adapter molecule Crk, partial [Fragariocoptes setiger]
MLIQSSTTMNLPEGSFDPYNEESWFYGSMTRAEATNVLMEEPDIGVFLVRSSTTVHGDLVLSVKETSDKVSHYIINKIVLKPGQPIVFKIGEQPFSDMPSLLDYYKREYLDTTKLTRPIKLPTEDNQRRRDITVSSVVHDDLCPQKLSRFRNQNGPFLSPGRSATNSPSNGGGSSQSSTTSSTSSTDHYFQRRLPSLARVIQPRVPNAYDKTALTLKVGDIINVTDTHMCGQWEGELNGRKGHFPFTHVEFIDSDRTSHYDD